MENLDNKIVLKKKTIVALSNAKGIGYYTIRKIYTACPDMECLLRYQLNDLINLFAKAGIKYSDRIAHSFCDNKTGAYTGGT